jgi:hypothetical protein
MLGTPARLLCCLLFAQPSSASPIDASVVSFPSGKVQLHGSLYKPAGSGPFPAIVHNHGSAPGMLSKEAMALGPVLQNVAGCFLGRIAGAKG